MAIGRGSIGVRGCAWWRDRRPLSRRAAQFRIILPPRTMYHVPSIYLIIFSKVFAVPPIATGPKTATVTGWFETEKPGADSYRSSELSDKGEFCNIILISQNF